MSNTPGSSVRKPTALDFPRPVHPLSPPDTDPDSHETLRQPARTREVKQSIHTMERDLSGPQNFQQAAEGPSARFRRLAYQTASTSLEGSRERAQHRSKWLVTVIPPTSVVAEHGHLGHTLSTGPSSRLAAGILLPLFPTMYGQLTAIQREFGFPSTSGLCLYLHASENGMQMTPRVSDDTWQLLWEHLFDERMVPPVGRLPIGGQIEFDIDIHRARWYNSWLSGGQRDDALSAVSYAPSHWRGDSRTTFAGPDRLDSPSDEMPTVARVPMPAVRHAPKQLSLLNRFDGSSTFRGGSRRPSQATISPPEPPVEQFATLAAQEEEEDPKTAKIILNKVVETWRASANAGPTLSTLTGQTSLDPVNIPNNLPIDTLPGAPTAEDDVVSVLNLDDYTWSISSAGPPSEWPESPISSDEAISIHVDRRAQGSVCLTPSTATSFGPPESWPASPLAFSSLPSPDLAYRMMDDAPLTPMTATSWGAPLEWPESPVWYSRAPSVDLGCRARYSRPVTPDTVTSWGAPSEWPLSPIEYSPIRTPHLGDRMLESTEDLPRSQVREAGSSQATWKHVFPHHHPAVDVDTNAAWPRVWPYQQAFQYANLESKTQEHFGLVWPYYSPSSHGLLEKPFSLVWPYYSTSSNSQASTRDVDAGYPNIIPYPPVNSAIKETALLHYLHPLITAYPPVYPSFEIYPGHVNSVEERTSLADQGYPIFCLYPPVKARLSKVAAPSVAPPLIVCDLPAHYPSFATLYKPLYPNNLLELYPAQGQDHLYNFAPSVTLEAVYPQFEPYPAVWPHVVPYPPVPEIERPSAQGREYANDQYPHLAIYSEDSMIQKARDEAYYPSMPVTSTSGYPSLVIFPPVYPSIILYPEDPRCAPNIAAILPNVPQDTGYPKNLEIVYPYASESLVEQDRLYYKSFPVELGPAYPQLMIYRPSYPYIDLYPSIVHIEAEKHVADIAANTALRPTVSKRPYPLFEIYKGEVCDGALQGLMHALVPPYPVFEIYAGEVCDGALGDTPLLSRYPIISLYSVSYPWFEIYPGEVCDGTLQATRRGNPTLLARYPIINLYSASYPWFEIYPGEVCDGAVSRMGQDNVTLTAPYPIFSLYAVSYPWFEIYPGVICDGRLQGLTSGVANLAALYPVFSIYPAVYPAFEIYPDVVCGVTFGRSTRMATQKNHLTLHQEVFGVGGGHPQRKLGPRRPLRTHLDLHNAVLTEALLSTKIKVSVPAKRKSDVPHHLPAESALPPTPALVPPPTPDARRRSRSGTVSKPTLASVPSVPRTVPVRSPSTSTSPARGLPAGVASRRLSGLPSSPAEGRRLSTLAAHPTPHAKVSLPANTPQEKVSLTRSNSMATPTPAMPSPSLNRSGSLSRVRQRDSLIAERMKAFTHDEKHTLTAFPVPPRAPLPSQSGRPPVSRLDPSKTPFA